MNQYQLDRVVGPTAEPLTVDEAKLHAKVEIADDDALISRLITAMRQSAETKLRRALLTQTFDLSLDDWPSPNWNQTPRVPQSLNYPQLAKPEISRELLPPLQSVTSITYLDQNHATQTVDPATYRVIPGIPGRIFPVTGSVWPAALKEPAAIRIRFIAGFTDPADDRLACVKAWMLVNLGTYYENREAVIVGASVASLPGTDCLLGPLQWGAY